MPDVGVEIMKETTGSDGDLGDINDDIKILIVKSGNGKEATPFKEEKETKMDESQHMLVDLMTSVPFKVEGYVERMASTTEASMDCVVSQMPTDASEITATYQMPTQAPNMSSEASQYLSFAELAPIVPPFSPTLNQFNTLPVDDTDDTADGMADEATSFTHDPVDTLTDRHADIHVDPLVDGPGTHADHDTITDNDAIADVDTFVGDHVGTSDSLTHVADDPREAADPTSAFSFNKEVVQSFRQGPSASSLPVGIPPLSPSAAVSPPLSPSSGLGHVVKIAGSNYRLIPATDADKADHALLAAFGAASASFGGPSGVATTMSMKEFNSLPPMTTTNVSNADFISCPTSRFSSASLLPATTTTTSTSASKANFLASGAAKAELDHAKWSLSAAEWRQKKTKTLMNSSSSSGFHLPIIYANNAESHNNKDKEIIMPEENKKNENKPSSDKEIFSAVDSMVKRPLISQKYSGDVDTPKIFSKAAVQRNVLYMKSGEKLGFKRLNKLTACPKVNGQCSSCPLRNNQLVSTQGGAA